MSPVLLPAIGLAVIASWDGAFGGFRAGAGRHGLVRHGAIARRDGATGLAIFLVLLAPLVIMVGADTEHSQRWAAASWRMMMVLGPYAVVALLALAVYVTMPWRLSYLVSAVILGPFTLVRPLVAVAGAIAAALPAGSITIWLGAAWAAAAALLVEPVAGVVIKRRWRRRRSARRLRP